MAIIFKCLIQTVVWVLQLFSMTVEKSFIFSQNWANFTNNCNSNSKQTDELTVNETV